MAKASAHLPAGPARGVLHVAEPDGTTAHERLLPDATLAPFVAHFWSVTWDLRRSFVASTLPHPCVHVVFETGTSGPARAEVAGVCTGRFERRLEGKGRAFGIKFRPAAFRGLLGASLATLTDRVVPIAEVFGPEGDACARSVFAAAGMAAEMAAASAFLAPLVRPLRPHIGRLRDLIERIAVDRSLTFVEEVATLAHLDVRQLQRAMREYAGVGPKWVLQRYRLHEAAERLKSSSPPSLAELAATLGYADQAHFTRDFKRVVGSAPSAFRHR